MNFKPKKEDVGLYVTMALFGGGLGILISSFLTYKKKETKENVLLDEEATFDINVAIDFCNEHHLTPTDVQWKLLKAGTISFDGWKNYLLQTNAYIITGPETKPPLDEILPDFNFEEELVEEYLEEEELEIDFPDEWEILLESPDVDKKRFKSYVYENGGWGRKYGIRTVKTEDIDKALPDSVKNKVIELFKDGVAEEVWVSGGEDDPTETIYRIEYGLSNYAAPPEKKDNKKPKHVKKDEEMDE